MNKQRVGVLAAVVALAAVLLWLVPDPALDQAPVPAAAQRAAAVPVVGSPGTFFGASVVTPNRPSAAASSAGAETESDLDRLWPHLRQGEPSDAERAQIRVEWVQLAARHPDNIYLPNEFQVPLTMAQEKAARQQLDDTTALVAKQAARKYLDKYAQPPLADSVGDSAPQPTGDATEPTEQQARDSGITPEQQRNYFNYKIKELESRIQLVEFYLNSGQAGATKKTAAQKELIAWKKELEEMIRIRAQVPNS